MLSNEGVVYDPEELSLLGSVLDQVMQSLPQNILACAGIGERDPDMLRRAALMDSTVAVAA
jgi:hypothetical protein